MFPKEIPFLETHLIAKWLLPEEDKQVLDSIKKIVGVTPQASQTEFRITLNNLNLAEKIKKHLSSHYPEQKIDIESVIDTPNNPGNPTIVIRNWPGGYVGIRNEIHQSLSLTNERREALDKIANRLAELREKARQENKGEFNNEIGVLQTIYNEIKNTRGSLEDIIENTRNKNIDVLLSEETYDVLYKIIVPNQSPGLQR